jgi:gliding motility-associated lipoprotein GldD
MNRKLIICVLLFSGFISCNSDPAPRPKGYFKIDLPPKAYKLFKKPEYPYQFEYPVYSSVIKDSLFFDKAPENPYWINLHFPQFQATLHVTYKSVGNAESLQKMIDDAFRLTGKHSIKASSIDEIPVKGSEQVTGFLFNVGGNAATGKQFFLTDSSHHFIRGALYFEATPNYDSIRPVEDFLYQDILHLIQTLRWKEHE